MPLKAAIFIPTEEQKVQAGAQASAILNALTLSTDDIMLQAYMLQIVLECFEEQYEINIRQGYSVSDDNRWRPKAKVN